uniref:RxLR effector candidate protein n=1 Tax=Hyaloperonospora arabidopsidis (strain Emoy2) TaxID=559515 RepID=M4B1Y2_HYAAE|nr:RxLR effector candidate protein [Hyaloperonospora arabidopsidis Emoy2]
MRLYPLIFLAFTAAPARATGSARVSNSSSTKTSITASDPLFVNCTKNAPADRQARAQDSKSATSSAGVSNSSLTKVDFTASDPLFVDGTKDAPADQQVRAQDSKNDEERIPTLKIANVVPPSYVNDAKAVLSELYSDSPAHSLMLPTASWSKVVSEDKKTLERVDACIKGMSRTDDEPELPLFMSLFGEDTSLSTAMILFNVLESVAEIEMFEKLELWNNQEDLFNFLKRKNFFDPFSFAHVAALDAFLANLKTEKGATKIKFDVLVQHFGGVGELASFLSLAKLSPFTTEAATSLQLKLLKTWMDDGNGLRYVVTVLGLDELEKTIVPLTYEHLDTLAVYWYLEMEKKRPSTQKALFYVVKGLRKKYRDAAIVPAMMDGLRDVQSAWAHLHGKSSQPYDVSTTLETKQQDGCLRQFKLVLFYMWHFEQKAPETLDGNPFKLSEDQAVQLREEYRAFFLSQPDQKPILGLVSG